MVLLPLSPVLSRVSVVATRSMLTSVKCSLNASVLLQTERALTMPNLTGTATWLSAPTLFESDSIPDFINRGDQLYKIRPVSQHLCRQNVQSASHCGNWPEMPRSDFRPSSGWWLTQVQRFYCCRPRLARRLLAMLYKPRRTNVLDNDMLRW